MDHVNADLIKNNPIFAKLVRVKARLSWGLAASTSVLFFSFVAMVSLLPNFAGRAFLEGSNFTNGIVYGMVALLGAVLFTGIYVLVANRVVDRLTEELREEVNQ